MQLCNQREPSRSRSQVLLHVALQHGQQLPQLSFSVRGILRVLDAVIDMRI